MKDISLGEKIIIALLLIFGIISMSSAPAGGGGVGDQGSFLGVTSSTVHGDFKVSVGYTTYAFDTSDGDLAFGQYADTGKDYLIRTVPKDVGNFESVYKTADVKGLTKVNITGQQDYLEFTNSDGLTYRVKKGTVIMPDNRRVVVSSSTAATLFEDNSLAKVVIVAPTTTLP